MKRRPATFLFIVLSWFGAIRASAHNPGLSSLTIDASPEHLDFTLKYAPPDLNGDGRISLEELAAGETQFKLLLPTWLRLTNSSASMPVSFGEVEILAAEEMLSAHASAKNVSNGPWNLELLELGKLVSGHREFVSVREGNRVLIEALLSAQDSSLTIPALESTAVRPNGSGENSPQSAQSPSTPEPSRKFTDFVKLGIEHILTGYDHLLYLAGLIVACRKFRSILSIITSFTIAHSITLALATTGAVRIAPSIVEPMIAASIAYVGIENLCLRGREPRGRWVLAFCFGLVHGFGFAGLLQDIGVGANGSSVILPLFSFNLGVEIGQLSVVAVALPILFWARRRPRFEGFGQPASSALIALAGMYWFVERVWF